MAFLRIREPPNDLVDLSVHQESTPSTFSSCVLHFLSKNAIFKTFPAIDLSGQHVDVYITSENLIFFSPEISQGIKIPYTKVILHAIHRTPHSAFDVPCIYMQIEDLAISSTEKVDANGDLSEPETNMTEIYILPSDPSTLHDFFTALSHCSSLHPCPEQNSGEETE